MAKPRSISPETAESLAVQALTFLGSDPERLGRFLSLSGIGPQSIRVAAQERGFLAGVLEHVAADQSLLLAFAAAQGIEPVEVDEARRALSGRDPELP